MIQFTLVPKHIRKIPFERLYTLKTRQTYLGIHREIVRPDMEIGCTRSALLGFIKERDAIRFKDLMMAQQYKKKILDRHLRDGKTMHFIDRGDHPQSLTSLNPVEMETVPRLFLLSMCIVHSMDLWVVDDFSKIPETYQSDVPWKMYCYEHRLESAPSPEMLMHLM